MRWTTFTAAEPSAYDEVRTRVYNREASRVSDEFLRCYRILTERTGDDPTVVKSLRMQDIILDYSLLRLKDIRDAFDDPIGYCKDIKGPECPQNFLAKTRELFRFVADASRQFHEALEDFRLRWSDPASK